MDLGIRGRNAVVFGGSRGIGRAVARALAAEGVNVAVCARKEWAARRVAADAEAAEGGRVKARGYALEAWDEASARAQVERIAGDFDAMDILFGIVRHTSPDGGQGDQGTATWSARLEDGFLRFRALTEALLPGMRRRRWGRVLWMVPWPDARSGAEESIRAAAGAALTAWLHSVAAETVRDNVTLNVLKPPPFWRRPALLDRAQSKHGPPAASGSRAAGEASPPGGGANRALAGTGPPPGGVAPAVGATGRALAAKGTEDSVPPRANAVLSADEVAAVAAFLLSDCARSVCGGTIELGPAAAAGGCGAWG